MYIKDGREDWALNCCIICNFMANLKMNVYYYTKLAGGIFIHTIYTVYYTLPVRVHIATYSPAVFIIRH